MPKTKPVPRWKLADLADLEVLLADEAAQKGAARIYREAISPHLDRGLDEGERRRQGLRLWLDEKRENDRSVGEVGARLESGLGLTGLVVRILAFLAGAGLVRGLLHNSPIGEGERAYHIWILLGTTVGLQWVLLLGGLMTWLIMRGKGRLSWIQELLSFLGRKLSGSRVGEIWGRLLAARSDGYGSVLMWRLAALSQSGAIWFNLGMAVGFLACLFFLKVNFYWESTMADLSGPQLVRITDALALPWAWLGEQWLPAGQGVEQSSLEYLKNEFAVRSSSMASSSVGNGEGWMRFFTLSILVWGMLPRLGLYLWSMMKERSALRRLDFQESRHRNLWRAMAKVERTVVNTSQADGVVLLDVGGAGLSLDAVRPFLLQRMRANPEAVYQIGVLDSEKESAARAAMKSADLGVVMTVEGWSLSGPQMRKNYEIVRSLIGEAKRIHFLVVGKVQGDSVTRVDEEEFAQWVKFVDSLRDPAVEAVEWEGS